MDNNEKLSAERSLKIISETIEQSRTDIMRNAGMPMIFWGILTCITSVAVCYLWQTTDNPSWNALWFLMAVIGWSVTAAKSRKDKKRPTNFFSRVLKISWISFGLFALIAAVKRKRAYDGCCVYGQAAYYNRADTSAWANGADYGPCAPPHLHNRILRGISGASQFCAYVSRPV